MLKIIILCGINCYKTKNAKSFCLWGEGVHPFPYPSPMASKLPMSSYAADLNPPMTMGPGDVANTAFKLVIVLAHC